MRRRLLVLLLWGVSLRLLRILLLLGRVARMRKAPGGRLNAAH